MIGCVILEQGHTSPQLPSTFLLNCFLRLCYFWCIVPSINSYSIYNVVWYDYGFKIHPNKNTKVMTLATDIAYLKFFRIESLSVSMLCFESLIPVRNVETESHLEFTNQRWEFFRLVWGWVKSVLLTILSLFSSINNLESHIKDIPKISLKTLWIEPLDLVICWTVRHLSSQTISELHQFFLRGWAFGWVWSSMLSMPRLNSVSHLLKVS